MARNTNCLLCTPIDYTSKKLRFWKDLNSHKHKPVATVAFSVAFSVEFKVALSKLALSVAFPAAT